MANEKYRKRAAPNLPTAKKLKELAEYRELYRKQLGRLPTWTSACHRIGIGYRTVKRHAPELLEKWNDADFHW
jgi:hypothetical protein